MGKEIKIVCDACGADVYGKKYVTLVPTCVNHGKQTRFATIWLCKKCFDQTKLSVILFGVESGAEP